MPETHTAVRIPTPPGTGRLGVVRAYFDIYAVLGALMTLMLAVAVFIPELGWRPRGSNQSWLALASCALLTYGSRQTSILLRQRRRVGAWAALFTFAATFAANGNGPTMTVINLVGAALVASVWRYLD